MINADNYGIDLYALRDRAANENKLELEQIFNEALLEAEAGNTEWYTRICKEIAFMISNTGMDALRIEPMHIMKVDSCAAGECIKE